MGLGHGRKIRFITIFIAGALDRNAAAVNVEIKSQQNREIRSPLFG
jgi:hypothetical protein